MRSRTSISWAPILEMKVTRTRSAKLLTIVVAPLAFFSCSAPSVSVPFYSADNYTFSNAERKSIETIAQSAANEVHRLLPRLPRSLVLRVQPSAADIDVTGETGYPSLPNGLGWIVDPHYPGGVPATINRELRKTLFHEWHHLVRYEAVRQPASLMGDVIAEGMATAFERDAAGCRSQLLVDGDACRRSSLDWHASRDLSCRSRHASVSKSPQRN